MKLMLRFLCSINRSMDSARNFYQVRHSIFKVFKDFKDCVCVCVWIFKVVCVWSIETSGGKCVTPWWTIWLTKLDCLVWFTRHVTFDMLHNSLSLRVFSSNMGTVKEPSLGGMCRYVHMLASVSTIVYSQKLSGNLYLDKKFLKVGSYELFLYSPRLSY